MAVSNSSAGLAGIIIAFVTYHPMPSLSQILFLALLFSSQWLIAQDAPGPRASLSAVFEKGNLMVALSEMEWRPGLTMAAARLETGGTVSLNLSLRANTRYVFIASTASGGASDADLYLRDTAGRALAQDQEPDGTPVLEYKTTTAGTYQLQLHLAGSNLNEEFVAVNILRGGGQNLFRQEYEQVANNFFRLANVARSNFAGTHWLRQPNQWCLFGYSLGHDKGITLRNLRPGKGDTFFTAAGNSTLTNLDLYLADESLQILANDIGPGAKPIIRHKTDAVSNYDLRVEVKSSEGAGLLLVGIFQK